MGGRPNRSPLLGNLFYLGALGDSYSLLPCAFAFCYNRFSLRLIVLLLERF